MPPPCEIVCQLCGVKFVDYLSNNRKFCSRRCQWKSQPQKHGHATRDATSSEYSSWENMIARCFQKNSPWYAYYGEQGITVCERWLSAENFLADMGPKPTPKHTLDRFPNRHGNYEPGNVRWATRAEQAENRDETRMFTHNGITDTLHGWAKRLSLKPSALDARIRRGWSMERAFTSASVPSETHPLTGGSVCEKKSL
jgi:hypothetical protein